MVWPCISFAIADRSESSDTDRECIQLFHQKKEKYITKCPCGAVVNALYKNVKNERPPRVNKVCLHIRTFIIDSGHSNLERAYNFPLAISKTCKTMPTFNITHTKSKTTIHN